MVLYHKLNIFTITFFKDEFKSELLKPLREISVYMTSEVDEEDFEITFKGFYNKDSRFDFESHFEREESYLNFNVYKISEDVRLNSYHLDNIIELLYYSGLKLTNDEILDEWLICNKNKQLTLPFEASNLLSEAGFPCVYSRQDFLEGALYFKNEILHKERFYHEFHVHLEDEFVYYFEKYILSVDFIASNEDFSKGVIGIETYLDYHTCLDLFGDWIVRENQVFSFSDAKRIAA